MSVFFENLYDDKNANTPLCLENGVPFHVGDIARDIDYVAAGLGNGQRVAIYCQSARRFLIALAAVWQSGGTAILPATDKPGYLDEIDQQFDLHLNDDAIDARLNRDSNAPAINAAATKDSASKRSTDCQAIFFTSGSSGTPKPIIKTLAQIEDEIAIQRPLWQPIIPSGARMVGLVSHQHIYGLIFRIIWPVMTKQTFTAAPAPFWDMVLHDIAAGDVLITSPAQLKNLHPDLADAPRPSMVLSSGGPLDLTTAQEATRVFGVCPTEIYGSTETGGIAWRQQKAADTPWHPLPDLKTDLNENGCLRVCANHIAGDDWYQTQDRAMIDQDTGCFTLKGRADRVVKVEGKRISLGAVEQHLRQSDLVSNAVALLADENDRRLAVVAVLTDKGNDELQAHGPFRMGRLLRREVAKFEDDAALPQRWRFVDQLPTDSQGKRPLHLLRALFAKKTDIEPVIHHQIRDGGKAVIGLTLRSDMTCFQGHFPGQPILPGVVQLHWVAQIASNLFGCAKGVGEVSQLKFRHPITPGDDVKLDLDFDPSTPKVKFRYHSETNGVHSSGTVKFRGPELASDVAPDHTAGPNRDHVR
ncbi:AMP-binding protein [Thalassospira lucentensis]|uniref:AMP-binding protein n=1 Tax=Thalassospira lucentensis TaxID=168935 RepID=UPI003AA8C173